MDTRWIIDNGNNPHECNGERQLIHLLTRYLLRRKASPSSVTIGIINILT